MTNCFLHIGYPKTATTSLQRNLFMRHPGVFYYGNPIPEARTLLTRIARCDDYDLNQNAVRDEIARLFQQAEGKCLVLSEENITTSSHPMLTAHRFKTFFPDATIIMTVRNQYSYIESQYANARKLWFAPKPYARKHVSFKNYVEYCFRNYERSDSGRYDKSFYGNVLEFTNYDRQYSIYDDAFGKDKIHTLVYEDMRKDPVAFIDGLSDILGIDGQKSQELFFSAPPENQRLIGPVRGLKAMKNRIFPNTNISSMSPFLAAVLLWLKSFKPKKADRLTPEQRRKIEEIFRDSNQSFIKKTGLKLDEHDYPGA